MTVKNSRWGDPQAESTVRKTCILLTREMIKHYLKKNQKDDLKIFEKSARI